MLDSNPKFAPNVNGRAEDLKKNPVNASTTNLLRKELLKILNH